MGDGTIAGRVDQRRWELTLPGLVDLTPAATDVLHRVDAALRYAGPDAVVTGVAACRLHGLTHLPDDPRVLVLVDHTRRRASAGFVVVERTRRLPPPHVRAELPLAPPTRAVLDAARRMRDLDAIRALLAEALQERLTTVSRLREELEAGSGRGTRLVRVVLEEVGDGIRSAAEAWARTIAREMQRDEGFPVVRWNPRLFTRDGLPVPTPDAWVDEVALAWEIQSRTYHLSAADQERTLRAKAALMAHGVVVVESTPRQLKRERGRVKADLRAGLDLARRRPRPDHLVLR